MRNCKRLYLLMRNITSGPVPDHRYPLPLALFRSLAVLPNCATRVRHSLDGGLCSGLGEAEWAV